MLFSRLSGLGSLGLKGKVDYALRKRDSIIDSECSLWDRQFEKLIEQGVTKEDAIRVLGERPSIFDETEEAKEEEVKAEAKRLNMVFDRIWGKLDNYILDDIAIKEITDKVMSVKNEIVKSNTEAKKIADSIVKEAIKNKNIFTLDETIRSLTDEQYDVVKAVSLTVLEKLQNYYGISDKDKVILAQKHTLKNYKKEVEESKYSADMGEKIAQKIIKEKNLMSQKEIVDKYYEGCDISFMNEYILYMDALENEFADYEPSNPKYFRIAVNRLLDDLRKISK